MAKRLDIVGEKYSKLTVVEFAEMDKYGKSQWKCLCDCGNTCEVGGALLKAGKTQSCGCMKSEMLVERNIKHGKTKTPEYNAWLAAKARTTNINSIQAKDYVDRGIIMEEPWKSNFELFLDDMGLKPSNGHSLERVDVNGNYCKENCIWASREAQAYNKRKLSSNTSGRTGVHWNRGKDKWEVGITVDKQAIYLGSYTDFELACFIRSEAELHYHGFTKE